MNFGPRRRGVASGGSHMHLGAPSLYPDSLRRWENTLIRDVGGRRFILTTDLNEIYRGLYATDLRFEEIYRFVL